jgi:hypothetical protein
MRRPSRRVGLQIGTGRFVPAGGPRARLSVYLPVRSDGRVLGYAELSQPIGRLLADEAAQGARTFWRSVVGGALLWLVLLPVWLRMAGLAGRAWAPRRRRLLRRLRRAIGDGELQLHYQPKVDLVSGELDGVEALVRWQRDGNLVSPSAFLPVVEQSPLIRSLRCSSLTPRSRRRGNGSLRDDPSGSPSTSPRSASSIPASSRTSRQRCGGTASSRPGSHWSSRRRRCSTAHAPGSVSRGAAEPLCPGAGPRETSRTCR